MQQMESVCGLLRFRFRGIILGSLMSILLDTTKGLQALGLYTLCVLVMVIKPPPPSTFLAILDPWAGFIQPGGGFITPFREVVLSSQRGGCIPPLGGGGVHPWGRFYHPFFGVVLSFRGVGGGSPL